MPKEGFGPEEVGGPITDIRASESRTRHKLSVVSERDRETVNVNLKLCACVKWSTCDCALACKAEQ